MTPSNQTTGDDAKPGSFLTLTVRIGIPVAFCVWAAYYVTSHPEDFERLLHLDPTFVMLLGFSQLASIWITSYFTSSMAKPFGVRIGNLEAFNITCVARALNMLLPMKAGAGMRALYLNKKYALPVGDFVAMFAGQTILTAFLAALIGLTGLGWLYLSLGLWEPIGTMFFAGGVLALAVPLLWSPRFPDVGSFGIGFGIGFANRVTASWDKLRRDRALVLKVATISLVNSLLTAFSVWVAFRAIEFPQSAAVGLYLGAIQDAGYLASITPGSLGIVEAATLFLGTKLVIPLAEVLSLALIIRSAVFLVPLILAPVCAWGLFGGSWFKVLVRGISTDAGQLNSQCVGSGERRDSGSL